MPIKIELNLDPTLARVALIAALMMLELILMRLIEIFSQNRMPTIVEVAMLICTGLLVFVTYILTFLKKEEG